MLKPSLAADFLIGQIATSTQTTTRSGQSIRHARYQFCRISNNVLPCECTRANHAPVLAYQVWLAYSLRWRRIVLL